MIKKKELQIHFDLNMLSDFRVMTLEDRLGHEGISLYIHLYFFLRMQKDYCHNCNQLELLASRFHTTVGTLMQIICDFGLFRLAEDGTFSNVMLDEEMEMGERFFLPEKKTLIPVAEKEAVETEKTVAETEKNTLKTVGNDPEKDEIRPDSHTNPTENRPENALSDRVDKGSGNNNNIIYNNNIKKKVSSSRQKSPVGCQTVPASLPDSLPTSPDPRPISPASRPTLPDLRPISPASRPTSPDLRPTSPASSSVRQPLPLPPAAALKPARDWMEYVREAFAQRSWLEVVAMQSGLGISLKEHLTFIVHLFVRHVTAQGTECNINSDHDAKSYFMNFIRSGSPTRREVDTKLKEYIHGLRQQGARSPYEQYDAVARQRSYDGVPIPADAPPRPNARAGWNRTIGTWVN